MFAGFLAQIVYTKKIIRAENFILYFCMEIDVCSKVTGDREYNGSKGKKLILNFHQSCDNSESFSLFNFLYL